MGVSYSEVMKALPDGIVMKSPVSIMEWHPMKEIMSFDTGIGKYAWTELGFICLTEDGSTDGMQVAGYDVSQLTLYFAHLPDGSGTLTRDDAHTAFYMGYYTRHPTNTDVVYEDLKSKLTSLYGDCRAEDSDLCFWYGADRTMISLARYHANFGSDTIYIAYGYEGGEDWILKAYEIETHVDYEVPDDSIDGL